MFSTPLATLEPRFEAVEAKAITSPVGQLVVVSIQHVLMQGFSLSPFAGVCPFAVETSWGVGVQEIGTPVQVSRMEVSCAPPEPTPRLVPVDAKAMKLPPCDMHG